MSHKYKRNYYTATVESKLKCVFLYLCLHLSVSTSLSPLYVSICLSICLFISLSLSVSVSRCLSVSFLLTCCLYASLHVLVSVSVSLSDTCFRSGDPGQSRRRGDVRSQTSVRRPLLVQTILRIQCLQVAPRFDFNYKHEYIHN